MEISRFIDWSHADIKSLQFEAKKAPKQKEVELSGKVMGVNKRVEMLNK
jgi:hypothetical protein